LIPKRRLGRMGSKVSVITLGGCGVGSLPQEEADVYIKAAFDAGVNMLDLAPTYGDCELRLAPWMKTHRGKVFLAEKTTERTREGAAAELRRSLNRLGVKSFDLYQMHSLKTLEEVDQAMGPGGAIEAFREAQETGLVKHLGITGHQDMRANLEALKRYDFDNVLLPVSLCSAVAWHPMNDFRPVLRYASEHDLGVTAIKAICRGRWKGEHTYGTWYHPSDNQRDISLGVRYTLSQGGVTTYSLPCEHRLWGMVLRAGEEFRPMTEAEQGGAVAYARGQGFTPLFPE
jgi:aryl-alcohol dehydrogenase-like predicted oxidoreductase